MRSNIDEGYSILELSDEELRRLQCVLLEMYKDITLACRANGLLVMLGGGSALGAIRHKGFIPWDDDLDLIMMRKDYEKFIEIFDSELGDKYHLSAPKKNNTRCTFAKVSKKGTTRLEIDYVNTPFHKGICIDIFPVDYIPDNQVARALKGMFLNKLKKIVAFTAMNKYKNKLMKRLIRRNKRAYIKFKIKLVIGKIFSFRSYKYWCKLFDHIASSTKNGKQCNIASGRKGFFVEIAKESDYIPPSQATFEGISVYVPGNVHVYLENLYGDYMSIPPVEKRERHAVIELDFSRER